MMRNMETGMNTYTNVHEFTGRAAEKPQVHYFTGGSYVTKFSVAVKPPYPSEEPIWCNCEAWGKLADTAANFLTKGRLIAVTAELRLDEWQDKITGKPRQKSVYVVKKLTLLSKQEKEVEQVPAA